MNHHLSLLFLFTLLLSNPAFSKIYKWVDENGRTQFSDKPHPSAKEVILKNSGKKNNIKTDIKTTKNHSVTVKYKSLLGSNIIKLRALLKKNEFIELNKELEKLNKSYKKNKSTEDELFSAYKAFRIKDSTFSSIFDSWVSATPDSYQPYLARAIFQYQMGWLSRGTKWASETKDEQMSEMASHFTSSSKDIIKAINLNGPPVVSYYYMIGITSTVGRDDETERFMRKALESDPASFNIRYRYIKTLTPKWGGSFDKMQAYIDETSKYISFNPRLKIIEGSIFLEAGDMQALSNKYSIADTLYAKSLEFGQYHETLFKRGKNNNRRGEYKDSLRDLNKAIELNYEQPIYYYWRAVTLIDLKEFKKAMNDIQLSSKLDPYDKDIQNKRKWLAAKFENDAYKSRKSQNPESAVEKYTAAIRLNPVNATMYHGRARAYIQQRDLNLALVDLKKAIEIEPHEIDHYLLIDYVLAKSKDWEQIIRYWDRFIKLHPDNGRAYVERGGTYFHKGDLKSAVKDAKISADLGNLEGIEAYEKFKDMVH